MELNELIIRRESWSESKPVRGKIEFSNPTGKVEINLTEQHCQKILEQSLVLHLEEDIWQLLAGNQRYQHFFANPKALLITFPDRLVAPVFQS